MDGRRLKQKLMVLVLTTCAASAAWCGGNGNFERTVGLEVARMTSVEVRTAPLPDSALVARLHCGDFCEPLPSRSKRLSVSMGLEDDRLDRRLRSGYRQLGERLASRLWDDPDGRRVKFDIEGRPGIGLEIPFD